MYMFFFFFFFFFYFFSRYFNVDKMAAKTSTEAGMLMNLGLVTLQESFGLVILRYFITIFVTNSTNNLRYVNIIQSEIVLIPSNSSIETTCSEDILSYKIISIQFLTAVIF